LVAAAVHHDHNRETMTQVWRDCAINGQYARQVRLQHKQILETPHFLRYRALTLLLSPLIATAVTARIFSRRWSTMRHFLITMPAIYLTKIAWCWGAARR